MAGAIATVLVLLTAILVAVYRVYLSPILALAGVFRDVQLVGTRDCSSIAGLDACEKIVLHEPSGLLYLACSSIESRLGFIPAVSQYNKERHFLNVDYVATYDHSTSKVQRLSLKNFPLDATLGTHGMDVVTSSSNPKKLFVYLVNHRINGDPTLVGADSVIEIFETAIGSDTLNHIRTIRDPLILTPNDVVGSPDGKSFYFTNDCASKTGALRDIRNIFTASTNVVHCHLDEGCKVAISGLPSSNGIAEASNGTIYVASVLGGSLRVLEQQQDHSLVVTDVITSEYPMDNLSIDQDGAVWAAAFVKQFSMLKSMKDGKTKSPVAALKFTINRGPKAFFGEKFSVDKPFEDDGNLVSGATSIVHDAKRSVLFIHGIVSSGLSVCKV
ncbi:hypothetical protein C8J56DRAFT_965373 [Mycena floridula]|nr:hypothetical protein C8J56DRAFT_965373 [Mycena floridula]